MPVLPAVPDVLVPDVLVPETLLLDVPAMLVAWLPFRPLAAVPDEKVT